MIVLDTDHFSELLRGQSAEATHLQGRLAAAGEAVCISIVTVEEVIRGWLKEIARKQDAGRQIVPYAEFQRTLAAISNWIVLPWDEASVAQFNELKTAKLRVGTMDLKIASIALSRSAIVLTRNSVDFERIPGLSIENWLE